MKLLVLLGFISVAASQKCGLRNHGSQSYIVGGSEALKNEFPWQISLQMYGRKHPREPDRWIHLCGGSILNEKWIVTAAHCVIDEADPKYYRFVAGAQYAEREERSTQIAGADEIIIHPKFDDDTFQSDIALIKLRKNLKLDPKSVYPICLPESYEENAFNNLVCVASGWGDITSGGPSSEVLRKVDLNIIDSTVCEQRYRNIPYAEIDQGMICAGHLDEGGKDTCQGDSGGPLACLKDGVYKLAGLTSYGEGCGSPQYPGVYTRLSAFREWIDGHIAK